MKIKGSVAVVTCANRGLGRAFMGHLLARGAKRIYAGARDPAKLRDIVSSGGGRVVALRIDLDDPASIAGGGQDREGRHAAHQQRGPSKPQPPDRQLARTMSRPTEFP